MAYLLGIIALLAVVGIFIVGPVVAVFYIVIAALIS